MTYEVIMKTARPPRRSGVGSSAGLRVSLILVADQRRFVVLPGEAGLLPCFVASEEECQVSDIRSLTEALTVAKLAISVTYLALLDFRISDGETEIIVAADVNGTDVLPGADPRLRHMTVSEIRASGSRADLIDYLSTAIIWSRANQAAHVLSNAIEVAFDKSVDHLLRNITTEDGFRGWNQFQDDSGVGVVSTAQGLLCHVHAAHRGDVVNETAATLEALQNEDGGWQVRHALVSQPSSVSVTESTCYCLWALYEAGRSASSPSAAQGIAWLEKMQHADGGWSSSSRDSATHTCATSLAVRVAARFSRGTALDRGVAWLRRAQRPDGGWGRDPAAQPGLAGSSAPAYTAHAVIALLVGGVAVADAAVVRGCGYLETAFDGSREEPWQSTSFTVLIDPNTSARLDFRLFATPWALAALSLGGRDVGDTKLLLGVNRLLELQEPSGAWRCDLAAPGAFPVWAAHDALFALRIITSSNMRSLAPIVLSRSRDSERRVMERAVIRVPGAGVHVFQRPQSGRRWLHTAWLSVLTTAVVVLALAQFGVLKQLESSAISHHVIAWLLTVLATTAGAILPAVLAEEYKIRRRRGSQSEG